MQMILQEGKKLFLHQKVLLWLILVVALKILSALYVSVNMEPNLPEEYSAYFQILGGKITEEKRQYIEQKYKSLSAIPRQINDLEEAYQSGEIAKSEYLKKLAELSKVKREQTCIKLFYNQYQYAGQDEKRRYIVQQAAWEELLTKESLDYLLLLFLFAMAVPIVCDEYQSEMQAIQICSIRKRTVPVVKLVLAVGLALLATLLFRLMEYGIYTWHLGGEYSCAPIQSLPFFEESSLPFSFLGLWWLITVCKMMGAAFLVITIMAIGIMAKRSLMTVMGSALVLVIPVTLSNVRKVKYLLPSPAGLLYAVGYFYPDLYKYRLSDETDKVEKFLSFQAFEKKELVELGIVLLLLLVLLVLLIIFGYQNKNLLQKFSLRRKGKFGRCMLLFLLMFQLPGCAIEKKDIRESFYEISCSVNGQINERYCFTIEENNILVYDLQTQEETFLIRDVFEQLNESEEYELSMYVTEDCLYYARDYDDELRIYRVYLEDFSQACIYQKKFNDMEADYNLLLVSAHSFFVQDAIEQEYYCIDREAGSWKKLNATGALYAAQYGDVVYYENTESHIACYDVKTKKETVYTDISLRSPYSVKSSIFYIYGDLCFYTNMLDDDNVYCYRFSTKENKLFLRRDKKNFFWCDDSAFYNLEDNGKIVEINLETEETRFLCEGEVSRSMDGKHLYQIEWGNEGKWKFIK